MLCFSALYFRAPSITANSENLSQTSIQWTLSRQSRDLVPTQQLQLRVGNVPFQELQQQAYIVERPNLTPNNNMTFLKNIQSNGSTQMHSSNKDSVTYPTK
jgi:hypothetical protein